jgi:hypothetical protein
MNGIVLRVTVQPSDITKCMRFGVNMTVAEVQTMIEDKLGVSPKADFGIMQSNPQRWLMTEKTLGYYQLVVKQLVV